MACIGLAEGPELSYGLPDILSLSSLSDPEEQSLLLDPAAESPKHNSQVLPAPATPQPHSTPAAESPQPHSTPAAESPQPHSTPAAKSPQRSKDKRGYQNAKKRQSRKRQRDRLQHLEHRLKETEARLKDAEDRLAVAGAEHVLLCPQLLKVIMPTTIRMPQRAPELQQAACPGGCLQEGVPAGSAGM